MPDISMCSGDGCKLKKKCYRSTAKPDPHRQSYFSIPPLENGKCNYYIPDNNEMARRKRKDSATKRTKR